MLKNLRDLPGFHVAAGESDIQGWTLTDRVGNSVGEVDCLLVDPDLDKEDARGLLPIRYLGVKSGMVTRLVPVGMVDIDETTHKVNMTKGGKAEFDAFPEFRPGVTLTGKEAFTRIFPQEKTVDYAREEFVHANPRITLLEEKLRVGKRTEQIGEVIAKKHVEEIPVDETIQLRREHVEVERRAVNKPLTEGKIGEGEQEIRMPIMAEEAVIEKVPYVKEEIILHKEVKTRDKVIHERVREEELEFVSTEPELPEETTVESRLDETKRRRGTEK